MIGLSIIMAAALTLLLTFKNRKRSDSGASSNADSLNADGEVAWQD